MSGTGEIFISGAAVLLMPIVEVIKELISLILKDFDPIYHKSIFFLPTIINWVFLILYKFSWIFPIEDSSEFVPPMYPGH